MGRDKEQLLALIPVLVLAGCGYQYKAGDPHILIVIFSLVGLLVLFGVIYHGKDEILAEDIIKARNHEQQLHAAEDEIRLKRDALYQAQQELLGEYDRLLTPQQKKSSRIVKHRRRILGLEREILEAEGRRNLLRKQAPF